ncbi:MAG: hypothetical protein ABJB40_02675 [Acidobacteriota bacterium]
MAKDVIEVDGKDVIVREDTAKAYRFVHWGVITAVIGLAIMAFLFFTLFWKAASDGKLESPADNTISNRR